MAIPSHTMVCKAITQSQARASGMQMVWMCATILSFAYELPLAEVTSMDRVNPRLFDLATLWALLLLPGLARLQPAPKFFTVWAWIIGLFTVFAILWQPWLPWYWGKYSLWYAAKYLQGLLVAFIFLRVPVTEDQKRKLWLFSIIGGLIVALYAVPEYLRGGSTGEIELVSSAGKAM